MGLWIPGPARYSWPAGRKHQPETPHEAAIANREEEPASSDSPHKRLRTDELSATSVVSAAVIGGELIWSERRLDHQRWIRPRPTRSGVTRPDGATGRSGTDGNTNLTVAGAPDTTLGKDGDYAINTVVWEIYGPRSGGAWGAGTPLRGNTRGGGESGVPLFGESPGDSGGSGGRSYTTGNLPLSGTGKSSHL